VNLLSLPNSDIKLRGAGSEAGVLGVRPEDLTIANGTAPDGGIALDLNVEAIERVGAETYVYGVRTQQADAPAVSSKPGELPPGEILVRIPGQEGPAIGQKIHAVAPREKLHLFTADGRKRLN
jgi:sn-glycerol 3-phosphate transport system ATP-binding protein